MKMEETSLSSISSPLYKYDTDPLSISTTPLPSLFDHDTVPFKLHSRHHVGFSFPHDDQFYAWIGERSGVVCLGDGRSMISLDRGEGWREQVGSKISFSVVDFSK